MRAAAIHHVEPVRCCYGSSRTYGLCRRTALRVHRHDAIPRRQLLVVQRCRCGLALQPCRRRRLARAARSSSSVRTAQGRAPSLSPQSLSETQSRAPAAADPRALRRRVLCASIRLAPAAAATLETEGGCPRCDQATHAVRRSPRPRQPRQQEAATASSRGGVSAACLASKTDNSQPPEKRAAAQATGAARYSKRTRDLVRAPQEGGREQVGLLSHSPPCPVVASGSALPAPAAASRAPRARPRPRPARARSAPWSAPRAPSA